MRTLNVITYGNGDILREIFNALAASLGTSTYSTIIHLMLLFAGTWAVVELILKRNFMSSARWIAVYFVAFYVVFLPKATVIITDRVAQNKMYSVDNVPLGLALLANVASVLGDSLTQLTEETFSLPDDLRYSKTGMVMASELVTAASHFTITNPDFEQNIQSFVNQCVFYDILLNKYSTEDLLTTPHLWQFITVNASPARAFLYNHTVTTCKVGAQQLSQDWQSAIDQASTRYAARLFPDSADAKTTLLQYLPVSYNFLTNLSDSASSLMQQNLLANAIQSSILGWSARTNAPAALESYAFNKAQQQNRIGDRTIGDMAAYWLPLLKNVLEGILYGAFIFVFLLQLFPFGFTVLRHYAFALIWLQLWAPLYAIINLYMNFYAQHHSLAASGVQGFTLASQAGLAQINSDIAGLAGYLSLSVPILSWALMTKGVQGMLQLAQYVGGVIQSGASSSAQEAATGNLSLGNTHFNTHSAFNTSANHFDTNARTATGMIANQMPGGSTLSIMPDGATVMNNQGAISNLGTSINLAYAIKTSATEQADIAYSQALSHQKSYSDSMATAERQVQELSRQEGISKSLGKSFVVSESEGAMESLSRLNQDSNRVTQAHSTGESYSINKEMHTGIQGGVGGGLPKGMLGVSASVSGNAGMSKNWHEGQSESLYNSTSNEKMQNIGYTQSLDKTFRAVEEGSYRATTEESQRLLDSISHSLEHAHQEQQQASLQFQKAESYREIATQAEENSASVNSNASQEFMEELEKNKDARSVENMMVANPEQAKKEAELFIEKKKAAYLNTTESAQDTTKFK